MMNSFSAHELTTSTKLIAFWSTVFPEQNYWLNQMILNNQNIWARANKKFTNLDKIAVIGESYQNIPNYQDIYMIFLNKYLPILEAAVQMRAEFIVGKARGIDTLARAYITKHNYYAQEGHLTLRLIPMENRGTRLPALPYVIFQNP